MAAGGLRLWALLLCAVAGAQLAAGSSLITVLMTECTPYFTWQSLGERAMRVMPPRTIPRAPRWGVAPPRLMQQGGQGEEVQRAQAGAKRGWAGAAVARATHRTAPYPPTSAPHPGMLYSHRISGQPGRLVRIMCCTEDEFKSMPEADLKIMETHVAPSYTKHPRNGDIYSAYNKPLGIIDFLAKNDIPEEYVLVIDADMVMRTSFTAEDVGAKPGLAVSAFFGYMKGVSNELALKYIPDVPPRNDTLAGPVGRRSDMVGGFTLMHRDDLRRMAPLWLKFTEDVRFDPDAWTLSGDAYSTNRGDRPWISEMCARGGGGRPCVLAR